MAQKQYKSSLKQKGFKPEQISNAGVERILQEGNRQVSVLRDQFAYEKSQRDNVLAAMKENARLEKQDRQKNFNLETQNRKDIKARQDANFKIQQDNRTKEARAQTELYSELSKLSVTASKKVADLQQEKFDKDYQDELNKILIEGPDYFKQAEYQTQEDQLQLMSFENEVGADAVAAAGGTPLQTQRIRSNSKGRQYARDKAQTMFAMQGFMPYALNVLKEQYPEVQDPAEKRVIIQDLLAPYMQEKGIYGLKPEFLTPALLETRKEINLFMEGERENFTKNLQTQAVEESTVAFLGNKGDLGINSSRLFRDLYTSTGDRTLALDKFFEAALELDQAEIEALGDVTLLGQPAPIKILHERRYRLLKEGKIDQKSSNWTRNQTKREQNAADYERAVFETFNANPEKLTAAAIEEAQKKYRELMGVDSQKIKSFEASTITARGKKAMEEYLFGLADQGKLSPDVLSSVADVELRTNKALVSAAEEYAAKYETPDYKRKKETLKTLVLGQGKRFSPEGRTLTVDGEIVLSKLEAEFDQRLTQIMANNPSTTVGEAANTALIETEKAFTEGFKQKDSVYYFDQKAKRYGNVLDLTIGPEAKEVVDNRAKEIRDTLSKFPNATAALENTEDLVFTKDQALQIASSYYKPGFATPALVRNLAQSLGDMTEIDVINAQLRAYDMPELPPPPTMALLNTVAPEIRSGLQNAQSAIRSTRFLAQTGQYNEAAIPNGYGSLVTEAAEMYNIPAPVLAGLIETESNWINGQTSSAGARGLAQFMPGTAAQFGVNVNDPASSIQGAAMYLRHLMDNYGFDLKMAIYAYNAGPGNIQSYGPGATKENADYYPKVMRSATKYGYGQQSFVEDYNLRPSMAPKVAYIAGNIGGGPYYTGQHTDVKQTNGAYFEITDLDEFVEVQDPELGRVPLSQVGVTGDWQSHTGRGSHGIDYGTISGSQIFLKNGAAVTYRGDSGDGNGDVLAFTLPDGREFQFLHGTLPN